MASSSGWTPMLSAADVHSSGNNLPDAVAARSPATNCSCVSVPASKNFSISDSSASATISMSASRARRGIGRHVCGDVGLAELAAAIGQKHIGFQRHEIDDAAERFFFANRQLNRNDGAAERGVNRLQRALEAGALAIEAIDDDQAGQPGLLGGLPGFFGLHLHAGDGIDDENGRVGHAQRRARVGQKVGHARRVDEVDLRLVPFGVGEAGRERVLAGDFLFVVIGDGGAVVDLAESVDRAGVEQGGRSELGLSGTAVADQRDIPDVCRVIDLHRR